MPPKQRTGLNLPKHIQPDKDKLPSGTWFNPSGKVGHWRLEYLDGGKKKTEYLCNGAAELAAIWQAYAARNTKKPIKITFAYLVQEYQKTHYWERLRPDTKKSYMTAYSHICKMPTKNGELGDEPISLWTRPLVTAYRDKRGKDHPGSANIELALIKSVFRYAHDYGIIKYNVVHGLSPMKVQKRTHLISMRDFEFFLGIANQHSPWYVPVMAELAMACRARLNEILSLTAANETPDGILIKRLKGSRDTIILWSPRLKQVWQTAIEASNKHRRITIIRKEDRYLIISDKTRDRISAGTFGSVWRNAMRKAVSEAEAQKLDFKPFTFHDIKKLAISSDTNPNKKLGSGHRTSAMADYYDLSIDRANSII